MYVCVSVYVRVCVCVCTCVLVCMYVCDGVCVYVLSVCVPPWNGLGQRDNQRN